jgi:protein SCO1/2
MSFAEQRASAYRRLLVSGLGLLALFALYAVILLTRSTSAPNLPVLKTLGSMDLVDQEGQSVDLQTFRGKPWFANIIFTRCPGPCARMTQTMRQLQLGIQAGSLDASLVSLSTDPEFDTPEVLSQYARKFKADTASWHFLTGSKQEIIRMATEEWLLVLQEKDETQRDSPNDIFLHSTLTVLIDGLGRIRGSYELLEEGEVEAALMDLRQLHDEAS